MLLTSTAHDTLVKSAAAASDASLAQINRRLKVFSVSRCHAFFFLAVVPGGGGLRVCRLRRNTDSYMAVRSYMMFAMWPRAPFFQMSAWICAAGSLKLCVSSSALFLKKKERRSLSHNLQMGLEHLDDTRNMKLLP